MMIALGTISSAFRIEALVHEPDERPGVRQVGQRVGQRRRAHPLELDRVAQHGRGLPAQALEQPQVRLGVGLLAHVVGRENADQALLVHQGEGQGRLEERPGGGGAGGLEVGAGARVERRRLVTG
jgi:hypothetical protein